MNDILAWEDVSISAGDQRTKLSFQRGYVPLLRVRLLQVKYDGALITLSVLLIRACG